MLDSFWTAVSTKIPPDLITARRRASIHEFSKRLPIEGSIGFELRLDEHSDRVDLSQAIPPGQVEQACSKAALRQGTPQPYWLKICNAWLQAGSPLQDRIKLLWFEYDEHPSGAFYHQVPSFFLEANEAIPPEELGHWLGILGHLGPSYQEHVDPAHMAPEGNGSKLDADCTANIVGRMYSRRAANGRVVLRPGNKEGLEDLLAQRAEEEVSSRVLETYSAIQERFDLTPCISLNLSEARSGTVGLELPLSKATGEMHRDLLGWLAQNRLAGEIKRAALARFPLTITPPEARGAWPEPLVVASLRRPENSFGVIHGRLHSVKLVFARGKPTSAKAYLGFMHGWYVHETQSCAENVAPSR